MASFSLVMSCLLTLATTLLLVTNFLQHSYEERLNINRATTVEKHKSCSFREYPPQQYYNGAFLTSNANTSTFTTSGMMKVPDFIREADYIYGQLPILLTDSQSPASGAAAQKLGGKICTPNNMNHDEPFQLDFADGTNPSIVSVPRLRRHLEGNHSLLQWISHHYNETIFVGTLLFKRPEAMQCYYHAANLHETTKMFLRYQRGTWLTLLDARGQILWKTSIPLTPSLRRAHAQMDWSIPNDTQAVIEIQNYVANVHNHHNRALETHDVLDDPRLFLHDGKLWINYKSGRFVKHNPLHFDFQDSILTSSLRDEETIPVCCGRNMGVLESPLPMPQDTTTTKPKLLPLVTWVDPLTVQHFDGNGTQVNPPIIRPLQQDRQTRAHGTTGFLLYLPDTHEYLGVLHLHKGYSRPYAVWGHHYTHAFYTISASAYYSHGDDYENGPSRLTRLSPEFVLGAHSPKHRYDGEVIQFAPGLEIVQVHDVDYVVLSYGINDCESAIQYVELERVQDLLRPVELGSTVEQLLMKATTQDNALSLQ